MRAYGRIKENKGEIEYVRTTLLNPTGQEYNRPFYGHMLHGVEQNVCFLFVRKSGRDISETCVEDPGIEHAHVGRSRSNYPDYKFVSQAFSCMANADPAHLRVSNILAIPPPPRHLNRGPSCHRPTWTGSRAEL